MQMARNRSEIRYLSHDQEGATGKIDLDYLRNDHMATAVAPFSTAALRDGRGRVCCDDHLSWTGTVRSRPGYAAVVIVERTRADRPKAQRGRDYCQAERPLTPAIERLEQTQSGFETCRALLENQRGREA